MRRAGRAYSNADIADAGGAHVGGGDSASATAAAAAAAAAASADYAQAFPCADIAMRTMFAPANGAAAAAAAAAADFAQAFPSADIAMPTRFAPAPGRPASGAGAWSESNGLPPRGRLRSAIRAQPMAPPLLLCACRVRPAYHEESGGGGVVAWWRGVGYREQWPLKAVELLRSLCAKKFRSTGLD